MVNKTIRTWCEARSILRRTTAPESPASNGRTERLLGLVRREARALLYSAKIGSSMWPHAARHANKQRTRKALSALGCPVQPMLPFWALVTIRARTWSDKKWSTRAVQGRLATPSADVDRGWIVWIEDRGVVRLYVSTLLYLDAKPAMGPPVLTEKVYPSPVHWHRTKGAVSSSSKDEADEHADILPPEVDTETHCSWPLPVKRHLSKSPARSVLQGSEPVPGSFLESERGFRAATSLASLAGHHTPIRVGPVDKTIVEEELVSPAPRVAKVVGPNPALHVPDTPLPGRYEMRGQVRFCRLTTSQWHAIRDMRPGQVPGLGDRWIHLTRQHLFAPVAYHVSGLIPVLLFRERYRRNWREDSLLSLLSSSGERTDAARVQSVSRYSTTSGGEYLICCVHDLVLDVDAVVLLWVEMQMTLVYEPLALPEPPRLAKLQLAAAPVPFPPGQSLGGGAFRVLALAV